MKKILSLVLAILMLASIASLAGCGAKETLKFGLGVDANSTKITSATDEADGIGQATATVAAVLVDKDGKIVKCVIDTADNKVTFTKDGKANTAETFKTKYELGENYGMKAYGGAKKEWFEQVDAFTALIVGKTTDEIKALVAGENKGTDEVINAGCTIMINEFVNAVVKAIENAKESEATADDTLKLGIVSSQSGAKDATADAAGANGFETSIAASVVNADKKVVANVIDSVSFTVAFDANGATETKTAAIDSKRQLGENYGMKAYGGAKLEWFEQADALSTVCAGKTASEISALEAAEGKGTTDVINAGCTIAISDMVKAVALSAN